MAVTRGSRRARGRCCAAGPRWWSGGLLGLARRAVRGGLIGRGLVAGLTGGGLAAGEELDALGDDVDPRGVAAVLGLELVEQQPAVDGHVAAGLQVLRARRRLGVEALAVEVAVVALLAGALDGDPQGADRGPALGLQELRITSEVAGAGPAVHGVLLAPLLGADRVTDKAATGARCGAVKPWSDRTRKATRSAGLDRSAAWVPTMQPTAGTRPAREEAADTDRSTEEQPACGTTLQDQDHRPDGACPPLLAIARSRITT